MQPGVGRTLRKTSIVTQSYCMNGNARSVVRGSSAVLPLLFAILFVGVLDNQVILPILSLIAGTFSRTVAELSWVITAYAFCAAALNLFFGPLSDRFGRKPTLLFGLT